MGSVLAILALVLLALTIVIAVVWNTYGIVAALADYFFGDKLHHYFLRRELDQEYREVLHQKFSYYQRLAPAKKILFERKVQRFIDSKEFLAGEDLPLVTPEMKALIGATAIQITFGFPRVYLNHFEKIFVYADVYQSKVTGRYHQGEVNTRGAIVLSWRSFEFGMADESDGRSLGLHEMAHALRVENAVRNKEFGFLDQNSLVKFTAAGREEIRNLIDGRESFFRKYAASNDQEFFAVALENFFERPVQFYQYHPQLYLLMAKMLRQDPRHFGQGNLL